MSDDFDRYTPHKYDRSSDGTATYWHQQFKKVEAERDAAIREAEERVRRETIEEAIKIADDNVDGPGWLIADLIRSLSVQKGEG